MQSITLDRKLIVFVEYNVGYEDVLTTGIHVIALEQQRKVLSHKATGETLEGLGV